MRFQRSGSVTPSQIELELETNPSPTRHNGFNSPPMTERGRPVKWEHCDLIQVASYLYLGGLEAAHNEQVLCQRKIASLVDVSGPLNNRERLARERILRKRSFPCTCQLAVAHSRAKLSVHIDDDEKEDFRPYLKEINTFIHCHRSQRRNVLVYSDAGQSRAPAIIAQYLVQMEHRSLALTLAHMRSLRPQIHINPGFMKILRKLERNAGRRTSREPMENGVCNNAEVAQPPAMASRIVSGIQKFMTRAPTTGQLLPLSRVREWPDRSGLFASHGRLASFHRSIVQAWG